MKNQYFGDKRDYFKYHLLEELATKVPGINKLTVLWMLTPNDKTGQGKVPWEPNPELPALTDFLTTQLRSGDRDVAHMRDYFRSRGIDYRAHGDQPPFFTNRGRTAYFASVADDDLQDAVVFVDPDTGITFTQSTSRHVHVDELKALWNRMGDRSVLVVIQFAPRRYRFWTTRNEELENVFGVSPGRIEEDFMGFHILPKPGADREAIDKVISSVASRRPPLRSRVHLTTILPPPLTPVEMDQVHENVRLLLRLIDEAPFSGKNWNELKRAFHHFWRDKGIMTFEVKNARMRASDLYRMFTERLADGTEEASRQIGLVELREQLRVLGDEELKLGHAATPTRNWAVYLSNDLSRVVAFHGTIRDVPPS